MKTSYTILGKAIIIVIFAHLSNNSFSQSNSLPTTGNVGIGTTNPCMKLQVNGSARIDSTLMVRDSIGI